MKHKSGFENTTISFPELFPIIMNDFARYLACPHQQSRSKIFKANLSSNTHESVAIPSAKRVIPGISRFWMGLTLPRPPDTSKTVTAPLTVPLPGLRA